MDLGSLGREGTRRGLPRTRGDGPLDPPRPDLRHWAPPHARGWTRPGSCSGQGCMGSPARAGMDRSLSALKRASAWLPRTRGDGPELLSASGGGMGAPPHARGWTLNTAYCYTVPTGSPARAGMDPLGSFDPTGIVRLPRTRGDGPLMRLSPFASAPAPPHARGWTASLPYTDAYKVGSPARAGMDR